MTTKDDPEDLQQRSEDEKDSRIQLLAPHCQFRVARDFHSAGSPDAGCDSGFHHLHAEVADLAQAQAGELRNRFAHLPKHIFDRVDAIAAGDRPESGRAEFPNRRAPGPGRGRRDSVVAAGLCH